jgi:AcrR family transcriptional regulator
MSRRRVHLSREEKRTETRTRILGGAGRVFARRGYHAASVDEIADEAGYTKGAVYYNFADKEALFLALLDQHMDSRLALLGRLREGASPSTARLRAGADATVASLKRDREWSLLYFEFAAYAARNPSFRRKLATRLERLHQAMVETVSDLSRDTGRPLSVPVETIALGLESLVDGVAMNRLLRPEAVGDELLGTMVGLVWSGSTPEGYSPERAAR